MVECLFKGPSSLLYVYTYCMKTFCCTKQIEDLSDWSSNHTRTAVNGMDDSGTAQPSC